MLDSAGKGPKDECLPPDNRNGWHAVTPDPPPAGDCGLRNDLTIGGLTLTVRLGQLPRLGAMVLHAMGVPRLQGSDLLRDFRVNLDFLGRHLGLRPQEASR